MPWFEIIKYTLFVQVNGLCNGKKCAANAECINFQCMCKQEYTGDGYTYCERKSLNIILKTDHTLNVVA